MRINASARNDTAETAGSRQATAAAKTAAMDAAAKTNAAAKANPAAKAAAESAGNAADGATPRSKPGIDSAAPSQAGTDSAAARPQASGLDDAALIIMRALLAYNMPPTGGAAAKAAAFMLANESIDAESAALLVSGDVEAGPRDLPLLSDIINGRYNLSNELISLTESLSAAIAQEGASTLFDLLSVRAVYDAISRFDLYESDGAPDMAARDGMGQAMIDSMLEAALNALYRLDSDGNPNRLASSESSALLPTDEKIQFEGRRDANDRQYVGRGFPDAPEADIIAFTSARQGCRALQDIFPETVKSYDENAQPAAEISNPAILSANANPTTSQAASNQTGLQTISIREKSPSASNPAVPPSDTGQVAASGSDTQDAAGFLRFVWGTMPDQISNLLAYVDSHGSAGAAEIMELVHQAANGVYAGFASGMRSGISENLLELLRVDLYNESAGMNSGAPGGAHLNGTLAEKLRDLFFRDVQIRLADAGGDPALSAQAISDAYARMIAALGLIRESLRLRPHQGAAKNAALRQIDSAEDALRLINDLNGRHQYLQIPFYYGGRAANLELFVMKRGGGKKKIDHENATLFFSLNTKNIGKVEALLHTGKNKSVSVGFRAENEGVLSMFKDVRAELHNSLAGIGYKLARVTYQTIGESVTAANAAKLAKEIFANERNVIDCRI